MISLSKDTSMWLKPNITTPRKLGLIKPWYQSSYCFCFGSLDLHMSFFKLTMKNNLASTMVPPYIVNLVTQLWISLASTQVIAHNLPRYLKLLNISMVGVIDFIKEKRCFNNLNFIKSKFCNQLTMHLDLLVWMFVQQIYMLENFPYPLVVVAWKDVGTKYGFDTKKLFG